MYVLHRMVDETTMRESIASVALIRYQDQADTKWLTRWNDKWRAYSLVGGHLEPGESFRDCIIREVTEELGLQPDIDFVVSPRPVAHLEFVAWSASARSDTAYTMELFEVKLIRPEAVDVVHREPHNRWMSEAEIRKELATDGRPVSETAKRLLNSVEWMKGRGKRRRNSL